MPMQPIIITAHHAMPMQRATPQRTKKSTHTKYFSFTEQKKGRVEGGSARGACCAAP
jgi:hypothetical protein